LSKPTKNNFKVVVHLSGKHPYRDEPEFQLTTRDVNIFVAAYRWSFWYGYIRDWNKADDLATMKALHTYRAWSAQTVSITEI